MWCARKILNREMKNPTIWMKLKKKSESSPKDLKGEESSSIIVAQQKKKL